jgi:hypothetical protein
MLIDWNACNVHVDKFVFGLMLIPFQIHLIRREVEDSQDNILIFWFIAIAFAVYCIDSLLITQCFRCNRSFTTGSASSILDWKHVKAKSYTC